MLKVAFAGKGGVGKTTIATLFIKALQKDGMQVLAVDCDPVAGLGSFLGIKDAHKIIPIVQMKELINERTQTTPERTFYKLNPQVEDIPEKFSRRIGNIRLIVMGTPQAGGSGCMCPESTFIKALLSKLLLKKDECVVMDMEAGVEHLGRGTAGFVDHLFIVTEPSLASIEAAGKINRLASEIKIKNISLILNKLRSKEDLDFMKKKTLPLKLSGIIPFEEKLLTFAQNQDLDLKQSNAYKIVAEIKDKILKERAHR